MAKEPDEPSLTVGLVLRKIASGALGMESVTVAITTVMAWITAVMTWITAVMVWITAVTAWITAVTAWITSVTPGIASRAGGIKFDTVGIDPDAGGIVFETRNQPLPTTKPPKTIAYLVTTGYPGGKFAFRPRKVILVTPRSTYCLGFPKVFPWFTARRAVESGTSPDLAYWVLTNLTSRTIRL